MVLQCNECEEFNPGNTICCSGCYRKLMEELERLKKVEAMCICGPIEDEREDEDYD